MCCLSLPQPLSHHLGDIPDPDLASLLVLTGQSYHLLIYPCNLQFPPSAPSCLVPRSWAIHSRHGYGATLHGHDLELAAVEFKLLQFLAARPGRIYNRQQLMDQIYPDERIVADRTIASHIKKLRRKIAMASPLAELIHSVYGVGYKFEESP